MATLADFGVQNDELLYAVIRPPFTKHESASSWYDNFRLRAPLCTPQSDRGMCTFLARTCQVLSHLPKKDRPAFLSYIQRVTKFQPLVHVLYQLMTRKAVHNIYHCVLLKSLFALFRRIVPHDVAQAGQVFEHSGLCWACAESPLTACTCS